MKAQLVIAALNLIAFAPAARAEAPPASHNAGTASRPAWFYFDAPLWDIADEGLPFRFTLALPSRRDVLARMLGAREAQWTLSAGYARVYNSFDASTGIFKNPGGHAALLSAGRQFRWHLPKFAGVFTPQLGIEFGLNFASRRFPADGTRTNLKLITGLEWIWPSGDRRRSWSAGVFWPHFSNANLFARNAGYDGLALRFGRTFAF